ncbi:MAG: hypothetical protein ACOH13_09220 [Flavobacteriales bacterium]
MIAAAAQGQAGDSAEVKFLVQPFGQVEYILNGNERLKEVLVPAARFPSGDHRLYFWAPNCSILDTTLHIEAGKDMELRKVLKQTPEFLAYKKESFHTGLEKALWRGLPLIFTVGFGLKGISDRKAHDQAFEELHSLRDSYATINSPSTLAGLKSVAIPAAQAELDATRRRMTTSFALFSIGVLATVYGLIRSGKLTYPQYEDKEKVHFEGLAWVPTANGGMYLAQIRVPIR